MQKMYVPAATAEAVMAAAGKSITIAGNIVVSILYQVLLLLFVKPG
jgi:hypothetical protein